MKGPVIDIMDLAVARSGRWVLRVPRLAVSGGDILSIMGPNGAGKTTLLGVLLGLVRLERGTVCVLGENMGRSTWRERARVRRRVGYVPQLTPTRGETPLTVREVVAMGRAAARGLWVRLDASDWDKVDFWLDRLALQAVSAQVYGALSGGQQRKVLIARALVQEPELLLLDEPTAHLDLGWRERIVDTIQRIYEQTSLTVVLVCHELEVIPTCCRRVVLLDQGCIAAEGEVESVFTGPRVAAFYGAGLTVVHQQGRHAVVPRGGAG